MKEPSLCCEMIVSVVIFCINWNNYMERSENVQQVMKAIAELSDLKIAKENRNFINDKVHTLNCVWSKPSNHRSFIYSLNEMANRFNVKLDQQLTIVIETMFEVCAGANVIPVNAPNATEFASIICEVLDNKVIEYDIRTKKFYVVGETPPTTKQTILKIVKYYYKKFISIITFWRKK